MPKGRVEISEKYCKGCSLCVYACPRKVLAISGRINAKGYRPVEAAKADDCVGCGLCERVCPMRNLSMQNGRPLPRGRCTMCYRCISLCPRKAITLLGKEVTEQCRIENYLSNEKEDAE